MHREEWMEMMEIMQEIRRFCRLHVKRGTTARISSSQELDLLSRVGLSEERMTPHALCLCMGVSKPLVSRLIESLEEKGFLVKEISPTDRRSYFLKITDKGRAEVREAYEIYLKPVYQTKEALGNEKFSQLTSLIRLCNEQEQPEMMERVYHSAISGRESI